MKAQHDSELESKFAVTILADSGGKGQNGVAQLGMAARDCPRPRYVRIMLRLMPHFSGLCLDKI